MLHDYFLNGIPLSLDSIHNLSVTFSFDLTFNAHIHTVSRRALKGLRFIMRSCKYLKNVETIKLLYCTLVRPQLEYCAIVWDPYQIKYCN